MYNELSNLNVYYGCAKINKIRKRPAISIVFENAIEARSERGKKTLDRLQITYYKRKQTIDEAKDGAEQNRIFTEYSLFYMNDLEDILNVNSESDKHNVSEDERERIKDSLREGFKISYKDIIP